MDSNSSLHFLFVINNDAGAGNNSWQEIINNYFTEKKIALHYHILDAKPSIEKLAKSIAELKPNKVIAVGGDGTVGLVARVVAGTNIPLCILPAGSANGMAKELNIPGDPAEALSIIENGVIKCCDAIMINNRDICLHLSDIGLNAQLIKYFNEGKLRGMLGYTKVVMKTLLRKRKMQVSILQEKNTVETEALMIVFANASKYGTGAIINPEGKLADGYFEVIIVKKLSVSYLLKVLFRFRRFNPKHVEIFSAKSVNVVTRKTIHFQVDGEYKGKINKIEAHILPGYINFILPRPSFASGPAVV